MKNTAKQSLGFGLGAVGKDMIYAFVSGFILYYYNDILGISGTFTGVMMMAARVFDAFNGGCPKLCVNLLCGVE